MDGSVLVLAIQDKPRMAELSRNGEASVNRVFLQNANVFRHSFWEDRNPAGAVGPPQV